MVAELIDIIQSLTALLEEETDLLTSPGRRPDLPELVTAKARLTGMLEARVTRLAREHPDWAETMDGEARRRFAASAQVLCDAATTNGRVLQRQIELSAELMTAVASEVQRLAGARSATYSPRGRLLEAERTAPISINASF